jgi:ABC-type enterobactin transport system permease subunit
MTKKIQQTKKAVMGAVTSIGTLVVMFVPSTDTKEKAIVGVIGGLLNAFVVWYTTNRPKH